MTSSAAAEEKNQIVEVRFDNERMYVLLQDGREISVPLWWYPRLLNATPEQRHRWEILPFGDALHWPDIDEDLDVRGFLIGAKAPDAKPTCTNKTEQTASGTFDAASRDPSPGQEGDVVRHEHHDQPKRPHHPNSKDFIAGLQAKYAYDDADSFFVALLTCYQRVDFMDFVGPGVGRVLFRGLGDATYQLTPRVFRDPSCLSSFQDWPARTNPASSTREDRNQFLFWNRSNEMRAVSNFLNYSDRLGIPTLLITMSQIVNSRQRSRPRKVTL